MVKVRLIVDRDQGNVHVCVGVHAQACVIVSVCSERAKERELGVPPVLVHLVPTSYSSFTVNHETTFCQSSGAQK